MILHDRHRRDFLLKATTLGAAVACGPSVVAAAAAKARPRRRSEGEEVTPAEDLMREHGVLNRILLVYEESIRRLEGGVELPTDAVSGAAGIVRRFVEDYHEKLEEEHLFPRLVTAATLADPLPPCVVAVPPPHPEAGRRLTADILGLATTAATTTAGDARTRQTLVSRLRSFVRMYRPHEAREDTVLFPALHRLIPEREYRALGDKFERREHERFGERGFEGVVDEVAAIEKSLGIYDLAQFTSA
jgi:hemerythrin-like domain-containing protein